MNNERDADRERIKQLEQNQKNMQDMFNKFISSQQSASGGQPGWWGTGGGQPAWGGTGHADDDNDNDNNDDDNDDNE
jgi:hypothetical protein